MIVLNTPTRRFCLLPGHGPLVRNLRSFFKIQGCQGENNTDPNIVEVVTTGKQWASGFHETPLLSSEMTIVEEAIDNLLAHFFDKRRASGDSRPCGPHDMVPVCMSVSCMYKEELKDECFMSRLRRSGLGDLGSQ
ncbi:hypothetical protein BDR22DRAFT_843951 [Usnea florida]